MEQETVKARLESLRAHIQEERDFNHTWIALHLRDGHPQASERRKEVVAERDAWLQALDEVLARLRRDEAEADKPQLWEQGLS